MTYSAEESKQELVKKDTQKKTKESSSKDDR
jgi:hypothetical protein